MRQKNPETAWWLRVVLWVYRRVCGYGERCLPPLFWAGVLLVVSTCCNLQWGLLRVKGGCSVVGWAEAGLYGLKTMILLKPTNFEPTGLAGDVVNIVQTIAGPLLFGFFALALRQRLKR